jgi:hypothetical protein
MLRATQTSVHHRDRLRPMRQRPFRILRWVVTEFGSDAPPDIDPERLAA